MAGDPAFRTSQRTIDLVVLCLGAGLKSEASMLRHTVLPSVTSLCTRQSVQLRVHPRWPEDAAHDERQGDFAETPVDRLRDLVSDDHVFVFAVIGPDMTDADVALIKSVRNARPGRDSRVLYVFLLRPSGYSEAVRPLFEELWRGAHVDGYQHATPDILKRALIDLLLAGKGLSYAPGSARKIIPHETPASARKPGFAADLGVDMSADVETPQLPQESASRPPATVVDENVQFTVYRPNAVQPEVWYPLLAFAHLAERRAGASPGQPDPLEQVRTLAAQAGVEAYGGPRVDARGGVPREGQLTFVPFVEGVDFNPRSQTFEWQEDVHQQNFRLKARSFTEGLVLRGRLTVYLGAFILADIDLAFRVDVAAKPPPTPSVRPLTLLGTSSAAWESGLTPVSAVPYQKVFPSYSHKDVAIVAQAEAYGKSLGHVYLRDRQALRSGEQWEVRLLKLIDEADIFQLFWSSNSMRSKYVRREWEHAIALGRPGFIRPTYWEVPMPQSANPRLPPDALARLHFHGFFEESNGGLDRAWPTPSVSRPEPSTAVTTYVCSNCGERNAPGTIFCVNCHAFLAWDEVTGEDDDTGNATVIPTRTDPRPQQQPVENDLGTVLRPAGPLTPPEAAESTDGRLQISAEQHSVTVPATGQPATLTVRVMNTSTIVDGYGVEAPAAPAWLIVESDPIHLLPGTEQELAVRMRINSTTLLPAQQIDVKLRVRSMTQASLRLEMPVQVTVPIVDVPVQLRAEPRLIRMRDTDASRCTIAVDNSRSNRPMLLRLSGSDAEQAVQFTFDPPIVEVGPGATASVVLALTAAKPEPGQELTRQLTITANDGERSIETAVSLQQSTSVLVEDSPVTLKAVPSLRLSRLAAFLGALIVVGVLVTFVVAGSDGPPGFGAVLFLAGCVAGYIGGKLIKR
jgi:hypothetical protein